MAQYFINRPVFAWVIALVIMLAGILAIQELPVSQYPSVAPPTVTIQATYPGASAKTVEVAPDVDPVMTSPFANEPPKVFCSSTSLLPASKPFLSV